MVDYEKAAEELDSRGLDLDESDHDEKLNHRVSIGLFVESEGEVEIALIYGGLSVLPSCLNAI